MELKYKVGDDVLLKGTVVSVDPSDGNLPYRVEFGSGAMWVNAKDITQKVAEAQRRPQVGDWVICNDDVFHDAVGQIAKDDHSYLPFKVVFADGRHQWFYESEVKLTDKPTEDQESSTKFKVGDWVKSIAGSCEDLVGQIIENDGSFIPYLVKFTGVDEPHWKLESSVVAAEEPKPALRFKVGDWVRKVGGECNVGKVGKIIEIYTDIMPSIPYLVDFQDGQPDPTMWCSDDSLVPAEEPKKRPQVGDLVSCTCTSSDCWTKGLVGQITEDDGSDIPFRVEFSGDRAHWFRESQVTPATKPEEPKPPLKFKVGEHVIHKFAPHWGVGKITDISEGNIGFDLTQHYEGSMDVKANQPVAENTCPYRVVYPEVTGRGLDRRWWTSEANLIRVEVK